MNKLQKMQEWLLEFNCFNGEDDYEYILENGKVSHSLVEETIDALILAYDIPCRFVTREQRKKLADKLVKIVQERLDEDA